MQETPSKQLDAEQVAALLVGIPERAASLWLSDLQPQQLVPRLIQAVLAEVAPPDCHAAGQVTLSRRK